MLRVWQSSLMSLGGCHEAINAFDVQRAYLHSVPSSTYTGLLSILKGHVWSNYRKRYTMRLKRRTMRRMPVKPHGTNSMPSITPQLMTSKNGLLFVMALVQLRTTTSRCFGISSSRNRIRLADRSGGKAVQHHTRRQDDLLGSKRWATHNPNGSWTGSCCFHLVKAVDRVTRHLEAISTALQ